MDITAIYVRNADGSKDMLGQYYFEEAELTRLVNDFQSFFSTGEPKSGVYKGRNAAFDDSGNKTVALRFDLVVAIG